MNNRLVHIAVLAVSIFVIWRAGIFHAPAQFPNDYREVWDPLDGDWYWAREDGCFANGMVLNFRDTKIYARAGHGEAEYAYDLVSLTHDQFKQQNPNFKTNFKNILITHGKRLDHTDKSAIEFSVLFEDFGNHLSPFAVSLDGETVRVEGIVADQVRPIWELKRCNNPSTWGYVQSFWRPPYDPDIDFEPAQILLN